METEDFAGFNIGKLQLKAENCWLKPSEILFLLQNVRECQFSQKPPTTLRSGTIFFYNKRVLRNFRQDGYAWRKKKDGKTVGEAHERLKVGNVDALNCYYAHGEFNPFFQRRSYWMLNLGHEHVVLVHYLEVSERGRLSGSVSVQDLSFERIEKWGHYDDSCSPGSAAEVNSDTFVGTNQIDYPDISCPENTIPSSTLALRKLAAQLSLEDYNEYGENQPGQSPYPLHCEATDWVHDRADNSLRTSEHVHNSNGSSHPHFISIFTNDADDGPKDVRSYCADLKENEDNSWKDMLKPASIGRNLPLSVYEEGSDWISKDENNFSRGILNEDATINEKVIPPSLNEGHCWNYREASTYNGTVIDTNKFRIREISPDWAYSTENTKVIIIGNFLCASEHSWAVMFGDTEVPVEIIQQGVLRCWAPQHLPGSVKLFVTSGNGEACSELREFTYHVKPESTSSLVNCQHLNTTRTTDELLLLVNFIRTLLCEFGSIDDRVEGESDSEISHLGNQKTRNDRLDQLLKAVLVCSECPSRIVDQLLEELLRDKLAQWLEQKNQDSEIQGFSSKQDCSILHMLSGLGYEWALKHVLDSGVGVNFRDVRGWTALHWAARFGREKIVATLIAAGALAGAVTDPTQQDLLGKKPASIAAEYGHKGLAGYLAEVALTSHLSSLTVVESEISRASATEKANRAVQHISEKIINMNSAATEDQLSLKDSLGAVINATQAAARIQSAFRAHSFRKKQQNPEASPDDYGMTPGQIHDAMSKHHKPSHSVRDQKFQKAALCIQNKFRGWNGRKNFLNLRHNVVKIQAHVRGHQVRKKNRFSMTVSILEKAILRWRRRGVGLRGHGVEFESENTNDVVKDEEEYLKDFRTKKVDGTLNAAVSRVLSMVKSPEARHQYRRMLQSYHLAKAELCDSGVSEQDIGTPMDESIEALLSIIDDGWANYGGILF